MATKMPNALKMRKKVTMMNIKRDLDDLKYYVEKQNWLLASVTAAWLFRYTTEMMVMEDIEEEIKKIASRGVEKK